MAETGLKVEGLKELQRALKDFDGALNKEIDRALLAGAEVVAREARSRFSAFDARSAAGFKPKVRGFGRAVVQQTKRSKHKRPDYGSLQMRRGLLPALGAKQNEVLVIIERLLDQLEIRHRL